MSMAMAATGNYGARHPASVYTSHTQRVIVVSIEMGTLLNKRMGNAHSLAQTISLLTSDDAHEDPSVTSATFNAVFDLIPYYMMTEKPRISLGMQTVRKALSKSPVEGNASIR